MALIRYYKNWFQNEEVDQKSNISAFYYCYGSDASDSISGIFSAMQKGGCFVGVVFQDEASKFQELDLIEGNILSRSKEIALAYFVETRREYSVFRTGWSQHSIQNESYFRHLDLRIKASGGRIEPSRVNPERRVALGTFTFDLLDNGISSSEFEFDLYDGSLNSSFKIKTTSLMKRHGVSFLAPKSITRRRINCKKILNNIISIPNETTLDVSLKVEPVTNFWFPRKMGELDISVQDQGNFPKFRRAVQHNINRNRLLIVDNRELPLSPKDTLGRNLSTIGTKNSVEFGFYAFPDEVRLKQDSPNMLQSATLNVGLSPVSNWRIKPSSEKYERRIKLGLSNTETLNMLEDTGVFLGMEFPSNYDDFGPAFIYEPLKRSKKVETSTDLLKNLPPITNWFRTPHPRYVLLNEQGQKISLSDRDDLRFSSQPSNLIKYRQSESRKSFSPSIPFQPEFLSDYSREILETFLPQINVKSLSGFPKIRDFEYEVNDLDEFMSVTRSIKLRDLLTSKKKKKRSDPFKHESITPQSFILKEERSSSGNNQTFILAQTDDETEKLELFVRGESELALDLKRPNFLIVLPPVKEESPGVYPYEIRAKFAIDDWAFQFSLKDIDNLEDRPQPLTILKYQKGKLLEKEGEKFEGMLVNAETWANQPHDPKKIVEEVKKWAQIIDFDSPEYRYLIAEVLGNPDWTGVLFINPALNIGDLPSAIRGAAAGSDMKRLSGHHIGFSLNKTKMDGDAPVIEKSSFFGMVDYKDQGSLGPEKKYDYKLKDLRVSFANSEVRSFKAKLQVKIPELLDETVEMSPENPNLLEINGNWEKITDGNGQKTGDRYSFELDTDINLVNSSNSKDLIQKITLRRIEYVSDENVKKSETDGGIWINSHLLIDADFKFGTVGNLDIFSFDSLGFEGLKIGFQSELIYDGVNWFKGKFRNLDIDFGNLKILTDWPRLRGGFMKGFPLKFRKFHIYLGGMSLPDIGFSVFDEVGQKFKFGFEFDVDFGRLAKLIGFDGNLVGRIMVGWVKTAGSWDWTFGYKFPDNGGDSLDLDLGFIRVTADYFDMFDVDDVYTMVANNGAIYIGDYRLPPKGSQLGFVISPNKQNPMSSPASWMISFGQENFLFLDDFFVVLGQGISLESPKPTVKGNVDNIIKLADFKIEGKDPEGEAKKFRTEFDNRFEISPSSEWFAGMRAGMDSLFEANIIYDPPGYFGGSIDVSKLFFIEISYKQLTPEVGLYSGSLKISENLASLDFGAVRVQIPKITAHLDTRGGWAINIGLNEEDPTDFSDAIAIEITIFKGDAGIYFGRLHGSAFEQVPLVKTKNNQSVIAYSPITKVIFAFRVGLGREFKKSILTAGASLTFYGVLSGIYGRLNYSPFEDLVEDVPSKYYRFYGEAGMLAEIYGVVDFKITRFRLHARLQVGYGIIFETERPTTIFAKGVISVRLRWVIGRIKVFGKKIEIKITLRFSASIYWEYELDSDGNWDDYFVSRKQQKNLKDFSIGTEPISPNFKNREYKLKTNLKKISSEEDIVFSNTIAPEGLSQPTSFDVIADLDTTLNDEGDPILIPQLIIPYNQNSEGSSYPGKNFETLVNFVLRWSLQSMDLWNSANPTAIDLDSIQLLKIDKVIGEVFLKPKNGKLVRMDDNERGQWTARKLIKHFKDNFTININSLPNASATEIEGTRFIGDFHYKVFKDAIPIGKFGDGRVSENIVQILDENFEHLRVAFENKYYDNKTSKKTAATKYLSSFLFEEYFEAILKSVWAELARLAHEETPNNYGQTKVKFLSNGFLKEVPDSFSYSRISSMVNSFSSSGARVKHLGNKTIWDHANAAILVDRSWTLSNSSNLDVVFEWSDNSRSYAVNFTRDSGNDELSVYPSPKDISALISADVEKLPLKTFGEFFTIHSGLTILRDNNFVERLYEFPKAFLRKYDKSTPVDYSLTLPQGVYETHTDQKVLFSTIDSKSSCLIKLPVGQQGTEKTIASDTIFKFELKRANESDRRKLALLVNALEDGDYAGCQIRCLIPDYGKDGKSKIATALHEMREPWIARSNISEDENPTSMSKMLVQADELRAKNHCEPSTENKGFLNLVYDAIHTNSGGYVVSAKLNTGESAVDTARDTEAIWLLIDFAGAVEFPFRAGISHVSTTHSQSETYNIIPKTSMGDQVKRLEALRDPGMLDLIFTRNETSLTGSPAESMAHRFRMLEVGIESISGFRGTEFKRAGELDAIDDLPTPPQNWVSDVGLVNDSVNGSEYLWSIPIFRRLEDNAHVDFAPSSDDPFMYGAVGATVKLNYGFRDVLGYRPLSSSLETQTIRLGYTDPIVTPNKLPFTTILGFFDNLGSAGLVYNITIELKKPGNTIATVKTAVQNYKEELSVVNRAIHQVRDKNLSIGLNFVLPINGAKSDFTETGEMKFSLTPSGRLSSARGKYLSYLKKLKKFILNDGIGEVPKIQLRCVVGNSSLLKTEEPLLLSPVLQFNRKKEFVDDRVKKIAEVSSVDCEIPITQKVNSTDDQSSDLSHYLPPLFAYWSSEVILGVSQSAYDQSQLYLLHKGNLNFQTKKQSTFSAIKPYSRELFTSFAARVHSKIDTANGTLVDLLPKEIDKFDIQAEMSESLSWIDERINRILYTQEWNAEKAKNYTNLANAKRKLARALSGKKRLDHIFDKPIIDPIESDKILEHLSKETLSNSFLKKLDYATSVETYLSQSGRVKKSLKGHEVQLFGTVNPSESLLDENLIFAKTKPSRIKLGQDGVGYLDLEIDVANPAIKEAALISNNFNVSHVLYQKSRDSEKIWISLISEFSFQLENVAADNLSIPILYKIFPSPAQIKIDVQDERLPGPNTASEKLVDVIRNWSFEFQVRNERASLQDDYEIDLIFNHGFNDQTKKSFGSSPRTIGEILYEIKSLRTQFEAIFDASVVIKMRVLTVWLNELATAIEFSNNESNFVEKRGNNGKLYLSVSNDDTKNDDTKTVYTLSWNPNNFRSGISFDIVQDEESFISRKRSKGKLILVEKGGLVPKGTELLFAKFLKVKNLDLMKEVNIFPRIQVHRNRTLDLAGKSKFVRDQFVLRSERSSLPSVYTPIKHVVAPLKGGNARATNQQNTVTSVLKKLVSDLYSSAEVNVSNDMRWGFEANPDNSISGTFHGPDPIAMWTVQSYNEDNFRNVLKPSLQEWLLASGKPQTGCYEFDLRLYHEHLNTPIIRLEKLRIKLD